MKLISKIFILMSLLCIGKVFASGTTSVQTAITNNTLLSWNLIINASTTHLSPIVERFGGTASWTVVANDGSLNPVAVYYSARGTSTPCLSQDRTGYMSLNTTSYSGDVITIIVNPSETGAPVCSCVGSACDVGFRV